MELPEVLTSAEGVRAAELHVDGLSVFCFNSTNQNDKFWEVAYPRLAEHTLRITIKELDVNGQVVRTVVDQEVGAGVKSFDISLTKGSTGHYDPNQFPSGGPADPNFDRNDPQAPMNLPNDLGWMVDLAGPELGHGDATLAEAQTGLISLARIRHSLFCTLKPEDEEVRISPIDQHGPMTANSFPLPLNNTEMVGVLLGTDSGDIQFVSEPAGSLNISPLPYTPQRSYQIEIKNTDVNLPEHIAPFVRGDLFRLYGVVINVTGEKKDLWAHSNNEAAPDGDCHPDIASFDTLEPLIHS